MMTSCHSTVNFAMMTGDESLGSLTKVTDADEPVVDPFGGNDGKNLFFTCYEKGGYTNIYKKENAFQAAITQKTSGLNHHEEPTYCAATDKIAFSCRNEGNSTSDIFMMNNRKGTTLQSVTESTDAFEHNPCFTSNGEIIVYDKIMYSLWKKIKWKSIFGNDEFLVVRDSEIWSKNLKTGENALIAKGYQPMISPDDSKIVYVKYSNDAKSSSIWIMDLDGSNQVQVTDAKKGYAMDPCWSPDGTRIIFASYKKDKKDFDLYVVNVDGDRLTQLTKNKSTDRQPYWTSDNYIYFTSDRGGKQGLFQIWRFKLNDL